MVKLEVPDSLGPHGARPPRAPAGGQAGPAGGGGVRERRDSRGPGGRAAPAIAGGGITSCRPWSLALSCPAVPRLDLAVVEVYVFRRRARRVEFLALRRRPGGSLPGVWQPVTGKLRRGERAAGGAAREVREETGAHPIRLWRLEAVSAHFDARLEAVRVVLRFAAELDSRARVRISREHTAHRFLPAREAARRFLWESQRRGVDEVKRQVLRGGPRARALAIPLPPGND